MCVGYQRSAKSQQLAYILVGVLVSGTFNHLYN